MPASIAKIWFHVSIVTIGFASGWSAMSLGYAFVSIVTALVMIAAFKWKTLRRSAMILTVSAALGISVAASGDSTPNRWMEGSIDQIQRRMELTRFYASRLRPSSSIFKGLTIFNPYPERSFIVSFVKYGPALIRDGHVEILLRKNQLVPMAWKDGTIYAYEKWRADNPLQRYEFSERKLRMVSQNAGGDNNHHFGDVFENRVYLPGRSFVDLPDDVSSRYSGTYASCQIENGWRESVDVYDAENLALIDEIDLLRSFLDAPELLTHLNAVIRECQDPLHTNTVYVLKDERSAAAFPDAQPGDLLVSMRNVDTVVLLDSRTHLPKWFVYGNDGELFDAQHDPSVSIQQTLLLFDNLGSDEPFGRSRIVEIDIPSKTMKASYEARREPLFHSQIRGKVTQIDEHSYLVQEQGQLEHEEEYPHVSLFMLECPGSHVSDDCQRVDIFKGDSIEYEYYNVSTLERDGKASREK